MKMFEIRLFRPTDAGPAAEMIQKTLREVSSKDYPGKVINFLCSRYTPEKMIELGQTRTFFVAIAEKQVIGTATLEGDYVGSVFVHPAWEHQGVGNAIMQEIENAALTHNVHQIQLGASITAVRFYLKRGYEQGAKLYSEEYGTTFQMTKKL